MPRKAAMHWWGIDVPKHILYYYHNSGYCFPGVKPDWKTYTIYDLIKKKVKKQEEQLRHKRAYNRKVPCYICLHKFSDNGRWNILIQTTKKQFYVYNEMNLKVRQVHSCNVFPEFMDLWAETFYKKYKVKSRRSYAKRAVKYTHCILDGYNNLIDVI